MKKPPKAVFSPLAPLNQLHKGAVETNYIEPGQVYNFKFIANTHPFLKR